MRYNNYYNKKITFDDLDYITEQHISEGVINITSNKMYKEVDEFNCHMLQMQKKREVYLIDFWCALVVNFLFFIGIIMYIIGISVGLVQIESFSENHFSLVYLLAKSEVPNIILLTIGFCSFIYFVFVRKYFEKKHYLPILIPLCAVNLICIIPIIANFFILNILEKAHNAIKGDAGYPYFAPLATTYCKKEIEEKMNKPIESYNFDDYKISSETEMGIASLDDEFDRRLNEAENNMEKYI